MKFFSYCPEDGFELHETAEEAKKRASKQLDLEAFYAADDGWHEDVETICWGHVAEIATQTDREERPDDLDEDGYSQDGSSWDDHEYRCNYQLMSPKATTKSIEARALEWMLSDDTGASSITLCAQMLGVKIKRRSYPLDPADLGRCLRLLEIIPEWKSRITEMSDVSPSWAGLVSCWDDIAQLMADEVGLDWSNGRSAPKTYDAIKRAQADAWRRDDRYECSFTDKGHISSVRRKADPHE